MSIPATVLLLAGIVLWAMFAISRWANAQLPATGEVPVHFDIKGRADAFGSRWVVLGLMPAGYVLVILLVAAIGIFAENEAPVSEILTGCVVLAVALLATHIFLIWLLLRWARENGSQ